MTFLIFAGIVAGAAGLLFLFAPKKLYDFCDLTNRIVVRLDDEVKKARVLVGTLLCIASIICFAAAISIIR